MLKSVIIFLIFALYFICFPTASKSNNKKKDVISMSDKEIDELYEEWERNDEDELPDDEKPPHLRPKPDVQFEKLKEMSNSPDEMIRLSKKGQSVMMFVTIVNREGKTDKSFGNRMSGLWQGMLNNNHVEVQVYVIEENRLLFMFMDGSRAWEARDFLAKQKECVDITLEGKVTQGLGSPMKDKEL